jgi:hypothetical protein
MVFEALMDSMERGELLLFSGAMCRYHLRRDGQVTIHEILVEPSIRRNGWGRVILSRLRQVRGAKCIVAKCPTDLDANGWYPRVGFGLVGTEQTPSGRELNVWRLDLG